MKKKIASILATVFCMVSLCIPAGASNHVPEMEIEVALRTDGSAYITQTWITDTNEGTEFYLACRDSGYLTITDFSVSDKNGPYTFMEDWDVDASFEEKARKCGILETDEGVELCWGISEYGENCYVIEYVLHDLVGGYSDADGFNHRFVDEMNFFPTDVVLTVYNEDGTPLDDSICDIWAFGYDGQIFFMDGVICGWTDTPLESGQHMTVMVALDKGVLSPQRAEEGSFEEVKERAFEDSDYEDDSALGVLAFIVVVVAIVVLVAIISDKVQKAKLNKRLKSVDYFRDVPNDGDLNVTHQLGLGCGLCKSDALLGAYLLRLISGGCLEPDVWNSDPKSTSLHLCHPPRSGDAYDEVLYTVLEAAAGTDGTLQPKELERMCQVNHVPLTSFMDSCIREGKQGLIRSVCLKGATCTGLKSLTKQGLAQLDEILGLKRYLLEFSLIQERGIHETVIWQDYMVYAMLLGIADKVAPQIKKLYPNVLHQVERYESYINYAGYYNGVMYNAYRRELQRREAARSSGSGGRASFGGGGGFSGGGGGGTR